MKASAAMAMSAASAVRVPRAFRASAYSFSAAARASPVSVPSGKRFSASATASASSFLDCHVTTHVLSTVNHDKEEVRAPSL